MGFVKSYESGVMALSRLFFVLILSAAVKAQAEEALVPLPDAQPDLPAPIESGEPMEPDVTIIRRGEETIEEYRINGRLVKVKVKPAIGPSYTFSDPDGDGTLDVRQLDNQRGQDITRWTLFSW